MRKSKRLELTEDCIKIISKLAIDEGTVFKIKAEQILEAYATIKSKPPKK